MSVFQEGIVWVVISITVIHALLANTAPIAEDLIRLPNYNGCVCTTAGRSAEQNTKPSPTTQSSTTKWPTIQSSTTQFSKTQSSQWPTTQTSTIQWPTTQSSTIQWPSTQSSTIQWPTTLFSTTTQPNSNNAGPNCNCSKDSVEGKPASLDRQVSKPARFLKTTPTSLNLNMESTEETSSLSPDMCKHSGLITMVIGCFAMVMIYMM